MVKEGDSGVIFCSRVQSPVRVQSPSHRETRRQNKLSPLQPFFFFVVVVFFFGGGGGGGGALRDIHKTAARETTEQVDKTK